MDPKPKVPTEESQPIELHIDADRDSYGIIKDHNRRVYGKNMV